MKDISDGKFFCNRMTVTRMNARHETYIKSLNWGQDKKQTCAK